MPDTPTTRPEGDLLSMSRGIEWTSQDPPLEQGLHTLSGRGKSRFIALITPYTRLEALPFHHETSADDWPDPVQNTVQNYRRVTTSRRS